MPKLGVKVLTVKEVQALKAPGFHLVGGAQGLMLQVTPTGARSWVLRYSLNGKRQSMGLGPYKDDLKEARVRANDQRRLIESGIDPRATRDAAKAEQAARDAATLAAASKVVTFREAAKRCHKIKQQEFKNPKHAEQWIKSLELYAFGAIGDLPASDITQKDVHSVLEPIWATIPETASRVRQRIAAVFDYCAAAGIRTGNNPAALERGLKLLLPATEKVKKKNNGGKKRHWPALPADDMPRLMAALGKSKGNSAKALQFAILTAARSQEVRLATWAEIDFEKSVWNVPAQHMKTGMPHTVPLSTAALALLGELPRDNATGIIFPSQRRRKYSDSALSKILKDLHAAELSAGGLGFVDPNQNNRIATPHGTARSTFKDWAIESGRFPDHWSELALAHVNTDKTREAYARGELVNERRSMMEQWGQCCLPAVGADLVPLKKTA